MKEDRRAKSIFASFPFKQNMSSTSLSMNKGMKAEFSYLEYFSEFLVSYRICHGQVELYFVLNTPLHCSLLIRMAKPKNMSPSTRFHFFHHESIFLSQCSSRPHPQKMVFI